MEVATADKLPSLLDLSRVQEDDRASAWTHAIPSLFPGLCVNRIDHRPHAGDIRRIPMGGGTLWAVRSPSAVVSYSPARGPMAESRSFSLMMQMEGRTVVGQQHRMCTLGAGDICLLDEQFPFTLEGEGLGEIVFLRMPRRAVLSRNPQLEHQTAITLPGVEPGVSLVGRTLSTALLMTPFLGESQRRSTLTALIELLGAVDVPGEEPAGSAWLRVRSALAYIELNFSVHGLSAEDVALSQRISRRRLDQLLRETMGVSITGQIWKRRLDHAAQDLCDPARLSSPASQIAFANGFEDASHFTRAFKRRYGCSPLQWRNLGQHQLPRDEQAPQSRAPS